MQIIWQCRTKFVSKKQYVFIYTIGQNLTKKLPSKPDAGQFRNPTAKKKSH